MKLYNVTIEMVLNFTLQGILSLYQRPKTKTKKKNPLECKILSQHATFDYLFCLCIEHEMESQGQKSCLEYDRITPLSRGM